MRRRARRKKVAAREAGGRQRESLACQSRGAPWSEAVTSRVVLAAVFLIGVVLARDLWPHVALPFRNPWGVVGALSLLQFNPANNLAAFALFVLLPVGLLLGLFLPKIGILRKCIAPGGGFFDRQRFRRHACLSKATTRWCAGLLPAFAVVAGVSATAFCSFGTVDAFHEGETLGTAVSYDRGQTPYP